MMTPEKLQAGLVALGLPEGDSRTPDVVCALIGHSNIITSCFGYIHCARCEEQIGDTIGGVYHNPRAVLVGHDCETCRTNYAALDWVDKFMTPHPFPESKPPF